MGASHISRRLFIRFLLFQSHSSLFPLYMKNILAFARVVVRLFERQSLTTFDNSDEG